MSRPPPPVGHGEGGPPAACDGSAAQACRWATVEVWLHMPAVVEGEVPAATMDRQVCLRCGAARLVRVLDGRIVAGAAALLPTRAAA